MRVVYTEHAKGLTQNKLPNFYHFALIKEKNNVAFYFESSSKEQIDERKIECVWVESTIKSPDFTERRILTKYMARKRLNGKSLEVVYIKERYIKIITVYWV